MSPFATLPECATRLLPGPDRLTAWAVAMFGLDGEPAYLNSGMHPLLGGDKPAQPRTDYLVNPTFGELVGSACDAPNPSLVFEGFLTIGDRFRESHTLAALIWRCDSYLLISAEHDVQELTRLNGELAEANHRVNSLTRELLKQNRLLEDALERLTDTQSQLIHSEKISALGQLVAGVAHEINNPLGFVLSNLHSLKGSATALERSYGELEALVQRLDPNGAPGTLAQVRQTYDLDDIIGDLPALLAGTNHGLERIATVVRQLRDYSRLDQAEQATIDLSSTINDILTLAGPSLSERGLRVVTAIAALPPIECYPAELNQVLMNLVVNAAQAMTPGGTLRIDGCPRDEDWIELRVEDTGCGIPAQDLGRIFDPFFTTKPPGSGTGLGLSLAHKIITERHGGQLTVASTPGTGTIFTLLLPRSLRQTRPP